MLKMLIASAVIFTVLLGWILVQKLAREFAQRHPEWGPYTEKGGCGSGSCGCGKAGSDSCDRKEAG